MSAESGAVNLYWESSSELADNVFFSLFALLGRDGVKMKHFVPAGKNTTHSLCVCVSTP